MFSFLNRFCKWLSMEVVIVNCAPLSLIHSVTPFAMVAAIIISTNKVQRSCGFTDKLEIFVPFL